MERIKLLTLNIWNRQGPWDARLALIREELARLQPDIVGLQEVLSMVDHPSQAEDIARGLGYEHFYAPAWRIGGGVDYGNAILSRYPILEPEVLELPLLGTKGDTRCVAFARIDAPCGRIPVFVTHLNWKLHETHVRVAQVKAIAGFIKERAPTKEFPPVLMGDMNADPDADEIRFLRGLTALGGKGVYFADCWHACHHDAPGFTYARDNPYALRSREPSRRIDYVFVRGPDRQLRGEPLSCTICFNEAKDGVFPSDHYGVYAEIQAAPRPLDPL